MDRADRMEPVVHWPDGRILTERTASRAVKGRFPRAEAVKEISHVWHRRHVSHKIKNRVDGREMGRGRTAGEAWLDAARRIVEEDARVAAAHEARNNAVGALRAAAWHLQERPLVEPEPQFTLEAAALRYAAERLKQYPGFGRDEERCVVALRKMADEMVTPVPVPAPAPQPPSGDPYTEA